MPDFGAERMLEKAPQAEVGRRGKKLPYDIGAELSVSKIRFKDSYCVDNIRNVLPFLSIRGKDGQKYRPPPMPELISSDPKVSRIAFFKQKEMVPFSE